MLHAARLCEVLDGIMTVDTLLTDSLESGARWICCFIFRELSVALVQGQRYVYRSCALLLAKASGRPVLPGADTPYLD
jgi:hypothetical protein